MKQKLLNLINILKSKKNYFIVVGIILFIIFIIIFSFNYDKKENVEDLEPTINEIKLKEFYEYELGSVPIVSDFTSEKDAKIEIYFGDELVTGELTKVGDYKVIIFINDKTFEAKISVKDKTITDDENIVLPEDEVINDENNNIDSTMDDDTTNNTNNNEVNKPSSNVSNKNDSNSSNNSSTNKQEVTNKNDNTNNEKVETNDKEKEEAKPIVKPEPEPEPDIEPEPEPEPVITVVSEEAKSDVSEVTKYGTKFKQTEKYTLVTYSDGKTEKKNVKTTLDVLDYSSFVTSTESMLAEATKLSKENISKRQEAVTYINKYRVESNVSELSLDEELSVAATIRALELAYSNVIAHTRPNGASYKTVIDDVYTKPCFYWGENLNGGSYHTTAKYSVESFRESAGHYANMINSRFKKVGIGYVYVPFGPYHHYWVHLYVE